MAGAILGDSKSSCRRWIIAFLVFAMLASILAASSHYHLGRPRVLAFPLPHSDLGHSEMIQIKEFVKPKDIKIVGLVFYGRKNRVEMLRCYLEVSESPSSCPALSYGAVNSATWSRTADG